MLFYISVIYPIQRIGNLDHIWISLWLIRGWPSHRPRNQQCQTIFKFVAEYYCWWVVLKLVRLVLTRFLYNFVGNSNLASYKPSQISDSVDFQLGITKSTTNGTLPPKLQHDEVNNHIVPASQEDTVSFSKSSTASDLLFWPQIRFLAWLITP